MRVMGDDKKTDAVLPVQFKHQFIDFLGGFAVQIAGWLIGQYTKGACHQSTGDGSALPFAS